MLVQRVEDRSFRPYVDPGDAGIGYPQPPCNHVRDVERPGNRRLDRTHVRHDDDGPLAGVVREVIARRSDALTQVRE